MKVKTVVSIGRLPDKERRKQRRFNHIARDLRTPKYKQRIINKRKEDWYEDQEYDG